MNRNGLFDIFAMSSCEVYWADWMQGEILKQRIGSDEQSAIITGLASPVDVAIDPTSGRGLAAHG